MKIQTQHYSIDQWEALDNKIRDALASVKFDARFGSNIVALDGDFLHTTNVNDARWLYATNAYDSAIIRINADGSMTNIVRGLVT